MLYAEKGIGQKHAKWSPVSTAWYRLHPHVEVLDEVRGQDAVQLAEDNPGLFRVKTLADGSNRVQVMNERDYSMDRNCIAPGRKRPSDGRPWSDFIKLKLKKRHYIFRIETVGQYKAHDLLREAIKILIEKLETFKKEVVAAKRRKSAKAGAVPMDDD